MLQEIYMLDPETVTTSSKLSRRLCSTVWCYRCVSHCIVIIGQPQRLPLGSASMRVNDYKKTSFSLSCSMWFFCWNMRTFEFCLGVFIGRIFGFTISAKLIGSSKFMCNVQFGVAPYLRCNTECLHYAALGWRTLLPANCHQFHVIRRKLQLTTDRYDWTVHDDFITRRKLQPLFRICSAANIKTPRAHIITIFPAFVV